MTWRRLTRAQARAEALADYRERVRAGIELDRELQRLMDEDDADRDARRDASLPMLKNMTSAQILNVIYSNYCTGGCPLPCDELDVLSVVLDELTRRRKASATERMRLRRIEIDALLPKSVAV